MMNEYYYFLTGNKEGYVQRVLARTPTESIFLMESWYKDKNYTFGYTKDQWLADPVLWDKYIILETILEYYHSYYDIAKTCFELVKTIRRLNNEDYIDENFDEISDERKSYLCQHVKEVILNPNISPRTLHNKWKKVRLENGWVYNNKKDVEKKQHPCLVEYEHLNFYQKLKDVVFIETIKLYHRLY